MEPEAEPEPEAGAEQPQPARRAWLRRLAWGGGIAVVILALLAVVVVLFFSAQVNGPSMLPGLRPGDRVLVDPLAYHFGHPHRGDVVTLDPPSGPRGTAVKRVIAVPGDRIEMLPGMRATVLVQRGGHGPWQRLDEKYLGSDGPAQLGCCDGAGHASERPQPYTVPPGEYFVLGDNRNVSYDSRAYGPVPGHDITGKVIWRVLPLSRFGSI